MSPAPNFYTIWTGQLNLGDTPGVFTDATFVGLLLQLPVTITFAPEPAAPLEVRLLTTDVEVFGGKKHALYWDWTPGSPLPEPVGFIDDEATVPGQPGFAPPKKEGKPANEEPREPRVWTQSLIQ